MPPCSSQPGELSAPSELVQPIRFDVSALPPYEQFLAWRNRVGQVIDVVPTRGQTERPFRAFFDRFAIGEFIFNDCYSDEVTLERSIARISQDNARGIAFQIYLDGDSGSVVSHSSKRQGSLNDVGIIAVDMDQPVRVLRRPCRHVTFMVPVAHVTAVFADPGMLHARTLASRLPAVQLIMKRATELLGMIRAMPTVDRIRHLKSLLMLILAAFGEQAGLSGSKNALSRAAMFDEVRRFVRTNLSDSNLSPDSIIGELGLSRPTIYRLFQHEGGLASYIQALRLRAAAAEIVQYPSIPIKDVGYAFGFGSASAFTRAFRRVYDIAPQDLRFGSAHMANLDRSHWVEWHA